MKHTLLLLAIAVSLLLPAELQAAPALSLPGFNHPVLAAKTVHVKSYTKKDGTYVHSHTRSTPRRK